MKTIILILTIFTLTNLYSNSGYYWKIYTNDERIINVKSLNFESGGFIVFVDDYDLERLLKVSNIALISRIDKQLKLTDCIILKDKSKITGDIFEYVPEKFISIYTIGTDSLINVDVNRIERFSLTERKLQKGDFLKYHEFGATLGYPAAVNLNFSYWYSDFGIGLSGLYIYIADGIQLNASYCFSNNLIFRHGLSLLGGISNIRKDKVTSTVLQNFHWEYAGISYNFNYSGFYGEFGLTTGSGNYSNPNPIFQIGYIHRFIKNQN